MHAASASAHRVRFGVFELDLDSGELRKAGSRIALQDQPFRILVRLLDRPGRIVTREDLRQELWPADTFVDFEHGLNAAVKRLRDALGDSAETPRFIETLPRRGYRFIAPVQSDSATPATAAPTPVPRPRLRLSTWLLAGLAVASIGAVAAQWRSARQPLLTPTDVIVLADLDNHTTDAVLTGTMKQALAVKLAESHFINLLSEEGVQETLAMMRRKPDEPLTPVLARDLCQRVGARATVSGGVAAVGSSYVISLNAALCSTGETLVRDQAQAAREEDILATLDSMVTRLRRRLGESLQSIDAANTPLERATTASLDALKAFTEGERRFRAGNQLQAVPLYRRAIDLDPDFAMAYAKLAMVHYNVGIPGAASELTRAFELRDRLTEREQFYVTAHYHRLALGDLESARPVYEAWKASYPRDAVPYNSLGLLYVRQGRLDRALTEFEGAARLTPTDVPYSTLTFSNLIEMYLHMARVDDAKHALERWERSKGQPIPYGRFLLAFHERNLPALEAAGAALRNDQGDTDNPDAERARAAAFFGRMGRARALFASAGTTHEGTEFASDSALLKLEEATWEAEIGDCPRARDRVVEAWSLHQGQLVRGMTMLTLAACGDVARAEDLGKDLDTRSFGVNAELVGAVIRARLDLAQGRFAQVLERLTPFRSRNLAGTLGYSLGGQAHGLIGAYLRGLACLGLNQPREAIAEFQQIVDHPGIAAFAPYHALAPLYLARAQAAAGDPKRSRAAYEQFLSLWKDADPDIPVLRAARQEYARLPGS
jgi:eukaryotic-like serine/threonine-protein kinase